MTDLTLRIEYAGGGTDELNIVSADDLGDADAPSLTSIRIDRRIDRRPDEPDTAECAVYRDAWSEIEDSLGDVDDTLFIDENGTDIFGGRLNDWEYQGVLVNVILDGPKRDAINETPSAGNTVYQPKSDDALVTDDLLPRVGTVGEGTIAQQTGSIAFSEANSSPGKSITKLSQATGAEVQYQPDFTMDYVGSLGTDKTGTTLSPSNGNILDEPRITHDPAEDFTHIRVLGSQQGGAQFVADRTIDGSTTRENWGFYTDKDAQTQDRVDAIADQIQSELQNSSDHLEVAVDIASTESPALGDEYTMNIPQYNINSKTLRIHELTRILTDAGERFRALLTNRRLSRDVQGDEQRRAFDEFRGGNPGQYYALTAGDAWDKVASGEDYELTFYRPVDTLTEYRAKLQIESRPYRLPSSDPGHTHPVDVTHPSHDHDVFISGTSTDNSEFSAVADQNTRAKADTGMAEGDTISQTFSPSSKTSAVYCWGQASLIDPANAASAQLEYRLENTTTGDKFPAGNWHLMEIDPDNGGSWGGLMAVDPTDCNGETLEFTTRIADGDGSGSMAVIMSTYFVAVGPHTHDISDTDTSTTALGTTSTETSASQTALDPGVNEQGGKTVSNVGVDIDGTTVVSGLSSPIDETVDIAGELSDGANAITATTDTLGELKLTVEYEALKNAE